METFTNQCLAKPTLMGILHLQSLVNANERKMMGSMPEVEANPFISRQFAEYRVRRMFSDMRSKCANSFD